jgi:hypothetical protein
MALTTVQADEEKHSASHVEVTFRDEYLARADMWRMSIAELSNRTVYRGQKLVFMGTIKATVKNVYINGQTTHSGYFSPTTKPVFRSESARYVVFIQMSKEMWDFDAEGAGEIMFNKVVNGFLPDLFKRWTKISARHAVTIILFTRMQYDDGSNPEHPYGTTNSDDFESQAGRFRDYYRVVVSDMASGDWINILYQLKKEFRSFLRDVSLVPKARAPSISAEANYESAEPDLIIAGKPSTAAQGNILEAINLAGAQFAKDYIDRDLVRTGISVIVVTAGTGVFEVDYNMLKLTTDTLVGSGIGIDLVCLSPMPLHSVPLFKYRSPRLVSNRKSPLAAQQNKRGSVDRTDELDEKTPRQHQSILGSTIRAAPAQPPPILSDNTNHMPDLDMEEWRYAMPHWVDISFWSGSSDEILELSKSRKPDRVVKRVKKRGGTFALRCRMYELQMMGVMEHELGDISIPYLEEDPLYPHRLRDQSAYVETKARETSRASKEVAAPGGPYPANHGKEGTDEHDDIKNLYRDWMEAYDNNAFSPLSNRRPTDETRQVAMHMVPVRGKDASPELLAKDSSLSSSFKSAGTSFGRGGRPSADTGFYQHVREVSRDTEGQSPRGSILYSPKHKSLGVPRADVLVRQKVMERAGSVRRPSSHRRGGSGDSTEYRRSLNITPRDSPVVSRGNTPPKTSGLPPLPPSIKSPAAKADASNRPGGWFLRQISFGGLGAMSKPTTGEATIDVTPGKVKPARLTVENSLKGAIAEKLASTRITSVEKPSQPIDIRSASRAGLFSPESPSDPVGRSVETVKGLKTVKASVPSHPGSVAKDPGSTFILAGSRALGESIVPKLDLLSSSGGAIEIPRTLSPTSAIAPWAVLVNPCNPTKNTVNVANQFRRWQHVFPKRLKTASVKWKSLCSPAAVPLTNEYFPTSDQLGTEYNESPYKIIQNDDEEILEAPKTRESLIRELIAFRLSHGFQIIVGSSVAEFSGVREQDLAAIFHPEYMSHDDDTVFMCVGNTIHQLVCLAGGEVEVKRYSRKPTTALQSSAGIDTPFPYKPYIRTALEEKYESREVILRPPNSFHNWNLIDNFLAGYQDELSDILRFWRARFVLIPVEIPSMNRRALPMLAEDSEEEVRLEGIRKLTQVWQKYRYIPPEERHFQAATSKKLKDPNPLAIEYHTRDPSAIVAAGTDNSLLNDNESELQTALFSETEQYQTSNIDIKKLAEDLQGEKGIPMLDRRWHWKLHYNCFVGFDLTSWLLSNFKDVETRDEAVEVGNQLMTKGLFIHVQKRHAFRDGNFFYQIAAEYRAPRPESRTGWFGMRKTDRSVPSTPSTDSPRASPLASRSGGSSAKSRPSTSDTGSVKSDPDGEKTPTRTGTPKQKVLLSRVMRYDVDPRRRSYRPEIISLHYDRLHNPDNCYHIRIDWMNVTAKLIEDAIVSWATAVEKYGLKLVEVPIAEASNITDYHPFRSPYIVKLALQPPTKQPESVYDTTPFSPQGYSRNTNDQFAYHKALLRKLNFVLDIESASSFPADVEVTYSWGRPDYKLSQFIHRSGTLLAQITPEGNFLLLANRLAHNRAKDTGRFRVTEPADYKRGMGPTTPAERADRMRSPFASPLARPVQDSSLLHTPLPLPGQGFNLNPNVPTPTTTTIGAGPGTTGWMHQTPEQIKDEIEAFCASREMLQAFFADHEAAKQPAPSPSPRVHAHTSMLDNNIPSLGLPPAISVQSAGATGWSLSGSVVGTGSGIAGRRGESGGSGAGILGARRRSALPEERLAGGDWGAQSAAAGQPG